MNLEIMLAPGPKKNELVVELDPEQEKLVVEGIKGRNRRAGATINGFEGGQMPIYRRLPKRGFKNPFRKEYAVINLGDVQKAIESGRIEAGEEINENALHEAGLVGKKRLRVRLLARGR